MKQSEYSEAFDVAEVIITLDDLAKVQSLDEFGYDPILRGQSRLHDANFSSGAVFATYIATGFLVHDFDFICEIEIDLPPYP